MWKLIQGDPDTVIRWCGPLLLSAMIYGFLCINFDLPGIISCMSAGGLGAAGGSLAQYRNERGLWMLSVLFLLIYGGIYVLFVIGQVGDILRNAAPPQMGLIIDVTVATALLSANIRFLNRTGRFNRSVSREADNG